MPIGSVNGDDDPAKEYVPSGFVLTCASPALTDGHADVFGGAVEAHVGSPGFVAVVLHGCAITRAPFTCVPPLGRSRLDVTLPVRPPSAEASFGASVQFDPG